MDRLNLNLGFYDFSSFWSWNCEFVVNWSNYDYRLDWQCSISIEV